MPALPKTIKLAVYPRVEPLDLEANLVKFEIVMQPPSSPQDALLLRVFAQGQAAPGEARIPDRRPVLKSKRGA